ncbi:hypothetical protein PP940_gp048 [Rhizobium phage RL2RES]|uniref:Uncharacterized protein n=1 Tax=Rhizobium phage RL2RES TaxID=103371 RepID=A0A6B9JDM8_9CAUD|nr:hypothetical protein PP940_gp048 [Rhizobium phage RL2RES]QGZ14336.1 hypothetical protein RL2RES_048 [Rhizobium phage RL2RES]
MCKVTYIEDQLGGKFLRVSGGKQVYELPSMVEAQLAIGLLDAKPFNFCTVHLPKPLNGAKPTVTID